MFFQMSQNEMLYMKGNIFIIGLSSICQYMQNTIPHTKGDKRKIHVGYYFHFQMKHVKTLDWSRGFTRSINQNVAGKTDFSFKIQLMCVDATPVMPNGERPRYLCQLKALA